MARLLEQVVRWLATGETGLSSLTMAHWLAFGQRYRRSSHPHDPDDLRRCLLLLDAAPLLRPELRLMAEVSPQWAALVARWDDLETLLRSELPSGRGPLTYELMQKVLRDGPPVQSREPASVAPEATGQPRPLSPAAQAIVQVFDDRYELCGPFDDNWQELCLAAALEALADQVVPAQLGLMHPVARAEAEGTRHRILRIAAELRGGQADG